MNSGWLSPTGEFFKCNSYEHLAIAQKLTEGKSLYYMADEYLLKNGWVKIYRGSFFDHKWHIYWRKFLSEPQKKYLIPIFEDLKNDIAVYCRDDFNNELGICIDREE